MNSCSPLRHAPPGRRRRDDAAGLRQPPVSRDAPRIFLPNLTQISRKLLYERSCLSYPSNRPQTSF